MHRDLQSTGSRGQSAWVPTARIQPLHTIPTPCPPTCQRKDEPRCRRAWCHRACLPTWVTNPPCIPMATRYVERCSGIQLIFTNLPQTCTGVQKTESTVEIWDFFHANTFLDLKNAKNRVLHKIRKVSILFSRSFWHFLGSKWLMLTYNTREADSLHNIN